MRSLHRQKFEQIVWNFCCFLTNCTCISAKSCKKDPHQQCRKGYLQDKKRLPTFFKSDEVKINYNYLFNSHNPQSINIHWRMKKVDHHLSSYRTGTAAHTSIHPFAFCWQNNQKLCRKSGHVTKPQEICMPGLFLILVSLHRGKRNNITTRQ